MKRLKKICEKLAKGTYKKGEGREGGERGRNRIETVWLVICTLILHRHTEK